MKVVGIIAEYNPFHNGHKLQLDYARSILKADYIIVAMSGSFTQRGTVACCDKYTRAKCALINGADLVLEIPAIFATASAAEYAACGISLLNTLGIVDTLLFGCENDGIGNFIENAKTIISLEGTDEYENTIKEHVTKGLSYASARQLALADRVDEEFITTPNNILGMEYTKYVLKNNIPMELACLKRHGSSYNSKTLTGIISSATSIREAMLTSRDYSQALPTNVFELLKDCPLINEDSVSVLLHHKLLSETDFEIYIDCTPDLSNKINKLKSEYVTMSDFCIKLKSKDLSYTRISRVMCHILLGITQEAFEAEKEAGYVRYIRLLGFTKNGSSLLSTIKEKSSLSIMTAPTEDISEYDLISSDLLRILQTSKTGTALPNEYTRKFDLGGI